jgi:hypothetical protein
MSIPLFPGRNQADSRYLGFYGHITLVLYSLSEPVLSTWEGHIDVIKSDKFS